MPAFRYTNARGRALRRCPECEANLTDPDQGVTIEFTDGSTTWDHISHLDAGGNLVDDTGEVEEGFLSCTRCGECGEALTNMDGVNEHDAEDPDALDDQTGLHSPAGPSSARGKLRRKD